ncbi:MAG: WYL domain-containing protein [Proteobacteria bacterium]|nr:WYL domain-containing protein [Pseudomonadota bacterium]
MKRMSKNQGAAGEPRWGQKRRLEFIDFRLRWNRTVNRGELVEFFRISIQQASADLAHYSRLAPRNMEYDRSLKTYRATSDFSPVINRDDAQTYLSELLGLTVGTLAPSASFISWKPPHDIVQYPARPIDTDTLLRLIWAIRDCDELMVSYQSMRRATPSTRWITPHALAFDGHRWHVRAWCQETREFRDFVISRIQQIETSRKATKSAEADSWWNTYIDVLIKPREGLTVAQRRAIETDFDMIRGRLKLTCRKALAFYVLRQMQVDRPPDLSPAAQPLELMNRDELTDVIVAAQKTPEIPPNSHIGRLEKNCERPQA